MTTERQLRIIRWLACACVPWVATACGARMGGGAGAAAAAGPAPRVDTIRVEVPSAAATPSMVDLDTVRAGRFDNGKMWTFEYPPLEYFREAYGLAPDSTWFARARLAALRLPNCSASFVSPHGLVMTNHHCARESASQVSARGENLLDNGFYAASLDGERPVADFHADQLVAIVDVTDRVDAALTGKTTEAARAEAREVVSDRLTQEIADEYRGAEGDILVEIISLWNGARTSAYVFKRYHDIRFVMAPELQMGYFGGDPDNFTYPRYALDVAFFRVYDEDGEPLETEHFFTWETEGVGEGDVVFVIGNPGSTSRLQTVAQLEFRREVQDKALLEFITTRIAALQAYANDYPAEAEELDLRNEIFSLVNSQKAYRGMWEGLHDPVIMAKRRDAERRFRVAIEADPALQGQYGGLLDEMAAIQEEKTRLSPGVGAFLALTNPSYASTALRRAFLAFQYLSQRQRGAPAAALAEMREQVLAMGDQPRPLQVRLLTARLEDFRRHLGAQSDVVRAILQGRSAGDVARSVIEGSVLADSAAAAAALSNGSLAMSDPALRVIEAIGGRFSAFRGAFVNLSRREDDVATRLGRARFHVDGASIPPDATFSLRIADGVVRSYAYNGTVAPLHTTFYGLYDHYHSYGAGTDWDLPERWREPPPSFDLSTPLDFISTADVIGGNSGSPVVDRALGVVGLVFDGNIESLPGDYIYLPDKNRTIAVDARGILEALDVVYDADRLVLELTTGQLAATEEEADAVLPAREGRAP